MRYSQYFIHTLYEAPKEAETPSHVLLLRGCYIHPVAAGLYALLPLGFRVTEKIRRILRDEMNGIGGMETAMPVLNPAELWKKSGRYFAIGSELMRLKDRKDREFVLAMTHEEVITSIARQFIRSYRDLPAMLYQIHTKIRDEARPRAGLIRVREFLMKDAYSFHPDLADLEAYYPRIFNAYVRIFARAGLDAVPVEADSGIMGGTGSHEFILPTPSGEGHFVTCARCGYRANTDNAVGGKPGLRDNLPAPPPAPERVATPGVKTIADLAAFFQAAPERLLKTVAVEAGDDLVLALIRGDFEVSATKLANHLKVPEAPLASEEALAKRGLHAGFLSPVGLSGIRVVADTSVPDHALLIAGGNAPDTHLKNVLPGRDFPLPERVDIAEAREGDACLHCEGGHLEMREGIEVGHTFKLGTKYTESLDVSYSDPAGEQQRVFMGCYGIGVERLMASAVERWHDEAGIVWPVTIAPFEVIITSLGKEKEVADAAGALHDRLSGRYEVLWDDRSDSPGVKLKDADLLGIPVRVVVSRRGLKDNRFEVKVRKTGEVRMVPADDLDSALADIMASLQPSLQGLEYLSEN